MGVFNVVGIGKEASECFRVDWITRVGINSVPDNGVEEIIETEDGGGIDGKGGVGRFPAVSNKEDISIVLPNDVMEFLVSIGSSIVMVCNRRFNK